MSLETLSGLRQLQRKLYHKSKAEPHYRFYALWDKVSKGRAGGVVAAGQGE